MFRDLSSLFGVVLVGAHVSFFYFHYVGDRGLQIQACTFLIKPLSRSLVAAW